MNKAKCTSFKDLLVWQKAHAFALSIYTLSQAFPVEERYGITSQIRRAAVSIAANVVEGFRKRGAADKTRFYNIAQGSADEALYSLILIQDLNYANTQQHQVQVEEISRMLQSYVISIKP
jgi:four helix bundle protein